MNNLFKVKYQITDKGFTYDPKEEEIAVPKHSTAYECIKKAYNLYRRAYDLSPKFTLEIISEENIGFCK